jgi:hypothetical protein
MVDPYVATIYCTFYLTKIDKTMTEELKNIIISYNETKLKHILGFERWEIFFLMFNKC